MLEVRALIKGQVQGVGFRACAKDYADSFQIKGFTKNLPDGRVELVMQGESTDTVLENLKKTFFIEEIIVSHYPTEKPFSDFQIM